MARAVFSNDDFVKALQKNHYIPVLVDGRAERKAMENFAVKGFPTVKFMDSHAVEIKDSGYARDVGTFIALADGSVKEMGRLKLHPDYMKLVKESMKLDAAVAKKKYKNAIKAIAAIEETGRKGAVADKAAEEKKKIVEVAQARFDEAKGFLEEKPKKARSQLKKLAKDFAGLELADEAKKLAATIK